MPSLRNFVGHESRKLIELAHEIVPALEVGISGLKGTGKLQTRRVLLPFAFNQLDKFDNLTDIHFDGTGQQDNFIVVILEGRSDHVSEWAMTLAKDKRFDCSHGVFRLVRDSTRPRPANKR